jgi:cell division protein FtsQ
MNDPQPMDIRLMNLCSALLLLGLFAAALVWAGAWAVRHPYFAVKGITVLGDTQRNSAATLRANVLPKLTGSFFSLDVLQAQRAFEQVPWVRRAVVQRDFPNRLRVRLQEHVPAALFGTEDEPRIVNAMGEVFVANAGDITEALPRLVGTEAQAPALLRAYQLFEPVFERHELSIEQLELTSRGSWRLLLDNGAVIDAGRGDENEVLVVLKRFGATLVQTTQNLNRKVPDLESADLRYPNGFALRLRGISTQTAANAATPKKK